MESESESKNEERWIMNNQLVTKESERTERSSGEEPKRRNVEKDILIQKLWKKNKVCGESRMKYASLNSKSN